MPSRAERIEAAARKLVDVVKAGINPDYWIPALANLQAALASSDAPEPEKGGACDNCGHPYHVAYCGQLRVTRPMGSVCECPRSPAPAPSTPDHAFVPCFGRHMDIYGPEDGCHAPGCGLPTSAHRGATADQEELRTAREAGKAEALKEVWEHSGRIVQGAAALLTPNALERGGEKP
jgi:hypothetical protein